MKAFLYALRGLTYAIKTERHMRIHLCFAFYVTAAGLITGISAAEWAAVLLCCGAVMGLECVNTALERLCDRVTQERDGLIMRAKDAAAGAVLVCAAFSAAAGCAVFFSADRPRIALEYFASRPAMAALLAASIVIWILMIFRRKNK